MLRAQTVNESIVFDQKIHDFGSISETGGKVTHRFRFTNKGSQPAVLLHARGGCSCVSADVPKQPIAPGASDYVTVTFDPDYRPGHFSKEIVVYSANQQYNRIWVKGDVVAGQHDLAESHPYSLGGPILSRNKVINFATVAPGRSSTKSLSVANVSDRTVRLDFEVENNDPAVTVDCGCLLRGKSETEVNVTVRPESAVAGVKTVKLYPVADGKRLQPIEIVYKTSN